jgi:hypothetical protein
MSDIIHGAIYDDVTKKELKVKIEFTHGSLFINIEKYGDACSLDGAGDPVVIDYFDGQVDVCVWSDINKEDPTHKINLEGALESKRKE